MSIIAPALIGRGVLRGRTDGDLFWWLTHGIAGTAMPAWQETLSGSERWTVVHDLRSLRRGKP